MDDIREIRVRVWSIKSGNVQVFRLCKGELPALTICAVPYPMCCDLHETALVEVVSSEVEGIRGGMAIWHQRLKEIEIVPRSEQSDRQQFFAKVA